MFANRNRETAGLNGKINDENDHFDDVWWNSHFDYIKSFLKTLCKNESIDCLGISVFLTQAISILRCP